MSKQVTTLELAEIVQKTLGSPPPLRRDEDPQAFDNYQRLATGVAAVLCEVYGGEVTHPADPLDDLWYVSIRGNEQLAGIKPQDNIWEPYDTEGLLFDELDDDDAASTADLSACSECQAQVSSLIGCPDGAEVCPACFNAGAH